MTDVLQGRGVGAHRWRPALLSAVMVAGWWGGASAAEWPQFRGPGGAGVGESSVPVTWSDTQHLRWKTPLPGPGSSSPIVQGDRVFVTC